MSLASAVVEASGGPRFGERRRRATALGSALLLVVLPAVALGQTADAALAETLFAEAKQLMSQQRFAEACPKLEESQRLDPGGGTLLNLASCHEGEGKTATAWAEYKQALAQARREDRADRVEVAEGRLAIVGARLSYLTVAVDPAAGSIPGLEVRRGGVVLARAAWSVATPVDPGTYVLSATAPGHVGWQAVVGVVGDSQWHVVAVPALARASLAPPPRGPTGGRGEPSEAAPPRRTVGWVVGGVGLGALGIGAVFGLRAFSLHGDSNDRCTPACTPAGVSLEDDARDSARISTAFFVAGALALATGAVLVLTAPAKARPRVAGVLRIR